MSTTATNGNSNGVFNPLRGIERTLGKELFDEIQSCRILLVGSGGIGCELLKNLALSGFRHVDVVDLDTIDVSNLNRQFLFRSKHVGQSKCKVGCDVALDMIPKTKTASSVQLPPTYKPIHGNVCDTSQFHVSYMSQFAVVLNALDNLTARRRVNRLCLAANLPLIEAGTTGYLGQVTVIHKPSDVACYECATKETKKTYPICTIRSTPTMPVHTIVWAKELYKLMFGPKVEDSMLYEAEDGSTPAASSEGDGAASEDNGTKQDQGRNEPSTYMPSVNNFRTLLMQNGTAKTKGTNKQDELKTLAKDVLRHLYVTEIEKQLGMGKYKMAKKTPAPIDSSVLDKGFDAEAPSKRPSYKNTDVWTDVDCVAELLDCLTTIDDPSTLLPSFDKDDDLAMRFVTASSQLRSYVFSINPIQSLYGTKGIAGNIIPAIATTNAIVAGIQVLQVFHILKEHVLARKEGKTRDAVTTLAKRCRYIGLNRLAMGRSKSLMGASTLDRPNPKCFVCRNASIPLALDTKRWTLEMLLKYVLKQSLGFEAPTLEISDSLIYEEGDDADTASFAVNLPKTLDQLPAGGLKDGSILRVEDFTQDLEVDIVIRHKDVWNVSTSSESNDKQKDDGVNIKDSLEKQFDIGGEKPVAKKEATASETTNGTTEKKKQDDDDDDIAEVDASGAPVNQRSGRKRPSAESTNGQHGDGKAAKKAKMTPREAASEEVIEID